MRKGLAHYAVLNFTDGVRGVILAGGELSMLLYLKCSVSQNLKICLYVLSLSASHDRDHDPWSAITARLRNRDEKSGIRNRYIQLEMGTRAVASRKYARHLRTWPLRHFQFFFSKQI